MRAGLLRRGALGFGALALSLVAIEIVLRLGGWGIIWDKCAKFVRAESDPDLRFSPLPDFGGYVLGQWVSTNDLGVRDVTPSARYNRRRILLLGDSVLFGFGVRDRETMAARLEEILRGELGADIEVINGGMYSYNTRQEAALGEHLVKVLRPEAVVFVVTANDVGDSMMIVDRWGGLADGVGEERLPPECDPKGMLARVANLVQKYSCLYNLVRISYLRWKFLREVAPGVGPANQALPATPEAAVELERRQWSRWLADLEFAEAKIDSWSTPTSFFVVSFDILEKSRHDRMIAELARRGFPAWSTEPDLGAFSSGTGRFALNRYRLWWDSHPNPDGQALLARLLAARMREAKWGPYAAGSAP